MLDKLKFNLAESVVLKKLSKSKNFGNSFGHFITDAKDVLVILPEKLEDIHRSLNIIQYLNSEKKNIYLYFNIDVTNYLPTGLNYIPITFKAGDKSKIGLPTKDLLSKIEIIFFDLVIDLNREDNLFSSIICNSPKTKYKIGFTKRNSDKFYNFQVPNEISPEKSYKNLLNSIRMF